MKSTAHIRKTFLNYFEKNDHKVVHSSPLVPINDPTLMFVNAGMVPFKNYFEGKEEPDFLKATSSQKCVRAGGKHNDLDNVGHTTRHLTFFEMLGNFSFGDYFKEEAIKLAWDLLVNEFEIPSNRLLLTVFKEATEAEEIWKKVSGFSDNKIIKISTDDNFWSMGDEGPCGPCSEIFLTMETPLMVVPQVQKMKMEIDLLKYGILFLCNICNFQIKIENLFQSRQLILEWA